MGRVGNIKLKIKFHGPKSLNFTSLQMLVMLFVSDVIVDISYNLNKYIFIYKV